MQRMHGNMQQRKHRYMQQMHGVMALGEGLRLMERASVSHGEAHGESPWLTPPLHFDCHLYGFFDSAGSVLLFCFFGSWVRPPVPMQGTIMARFFLWLP